MEVDVLTQVTSLFTPIVPRHLPLPVGSPIPGLGTLTDPILGPRRRSTHSIRSTILGGPKNQKSRDFTLITLLIYVHFES